MAYAFGEFSVIELLKHRPDAVDLIIVSDEKEKKKYISFNKKIKIDNKEIRKLIKKEDIYAVASFKPYDMKIDNSKDIIVIDGLNDEGEIGTIIRSALAFNYTNIILLNSDVDIFSSKLTRASVGAFFMANVVKETNLNSHPKDKILYFKNEKYLSLTVSQKLYKIKQRQCDNR